MYLTHQNFNPCAIYAIHCYTNWVINLLFLTRDNGTDFQMVLRMKVTTPMTSTLATNILMCYAAMSL